MAQGPNILFSTEYIKNVLYFAVMKIGKVPKNTSKVHYFTIDDELVYENYYDDFGPLKLGCVYKYCKILNEKLKLYLHKQLVVHYTSTDVKKMPNAAFLIACYGVLYLSLSPREALRPLIFEQPYRPFQSAVQGESYYTITLMDCVNAMQRARELGFFNFHDFNYEECEKLDQIHGGDRNWIVPGKFIAFVGPVDRSCSYHSAHMYIKYFKENNVTVVIRLNKRMYDENVFNNVGIRHYDLYFPDGECPPRHIMFKFLQICEETAGAIGVHCKAGLGRTGSLIGAYLIKHYRMTAREAIGWMRISRPGSVIGHQQEWLEKLEPWLLRQGDIYRKNMYQDRDKIPIHDFGVYSLAEKSFKYRPIVLHKSPSPPPIGQRYKRSETQEIRPQASRVRQMPKLLSKEPYDSGINVLLMNMEKPAPTRTSRSRICPRVCNDNMNRNSVRNYAGPTPAPTPKNSRTPSNFVPYGLNDEKNYRSNINTKDNRPNSTNKNRRVDSTINSSGNSRLNNNIIYYDSSNNTICKDRELQSNVKIMAPKPQTTKDKSPTRTPSITGFRREGVPRRRRLGRSPSPPQLRQFEQTRATNTVETNAKILERDPSMIALKEAISMLKVAKPRQNSIGNSSLGARRGAPPPSFRPPSVKSDVRPIATQGDILNSIKMQRRVNEISRNIRKKDKFCITPKQSNTSVMPQPSSSSRKCNNYGLSYSGEKGKRDQTASSRINSQKSTYNYSILRKN